MMQQLVLFDFDETITTRDSYVLFLKYITPPSKWYRYIFALPYVIALLLRLMGPGKSKAVILKIFVGNTPKASLEQKAKNFIEYLFDQKIISPGMVEKMISYKTSGSTVVVVSASPDLWIKPFCEKFGVQWISTELNYIENIFTGRLNTPNCKGPEKEKRIKAAFNLSSFTSIVVFGHGKGDREMLKLAAERHASKNEPLGNH